MSNLIQVPQFDESEQLEETWNIQDDTSSTMPTYNTMIKDIFYHNGLPNHGGSNITRRRPSFGLTNSRKERHCQLKNDSRGRYTFKE